LLGIGGLPSVAEDRIVERDIALAAETRCHLHVQHVSTAGSVELVANAKTAGAKVTAEVTPHHLLLEEEDVAGLDTNTKMYPPLRATQDRLALVGALRDGVIDAVATDHAPHSEAEKDVGFSEAPRGVTGLETAASVAWEVLRGDVGLFFDRLSSGPARIGRFQRQGRTVEVGNPANLVIWNPVATWTAGQFASRSANTPFLGRTMTGRVRNTIYEGRVVYQDGRW
jgi:dihydroorotase